MIIKNVFGIDIDLAPHSMSELIQPKVDGFNKVLSLADKFNILEEYCRQFGKQPHLYFDDSGFEIIEASKKFMKREGSHARTLSARAKEFITLFKEEPQKK